jgi:hypothetical protein
MEALATAFGILIRLAIPLGLLALASTGLRRWEARHI